MRRRSSCRSRRAGAACCMLHVLWFTLHLACCLVHVACCVLRAFARASSTGLSCTLRHGATRFSQSRRVAPVQRVVSHVACRNTLRHVAPCCTTSTTVGLLTDASSTGLFYAGIQQTSTVLALKLIDPTSSPTFVPTTPKPTVRLPCRARGMPVRLGLRLGGQACRRTHTSTHPGGREGSAA